jgi:hypothetical protein
MARARPSDISLWAHRPTGKTVGIYYFRRVVAAVGDSLLCSTAAVGHNLISDALSPTALSRRR